MAANSGTIEGTVANGEPQIGLPQMNTQTFPSQIFWLAITFGLLFAIMSRVAIPRIGGAIAKRRGRISGDLETAEQSRKSAADALKAYEAALAAARGNAHALADDNRKRVQAEIEKAKAEADAAAHAAMNVSEKRIAADRAKAMQTVRASAAEAAADIVERLIGERIGADEAARAVDGAR